MLPIGYQGAHKSGVIVTVYPNLGDGTFGEAITLSGTSAQSPNPCVINCHVSASLGQASSFSVTFKRAAFGDPFTQFPVDSWIDISFTRDGLVWHTLRGLTDEIRLSVAVSGGATARTYNLVGRSFQKIYEDTTAYFNAYLGDQENSVEVLNVLRSYTGSPDVICQAILIKVLRGLGRKGRALWCMPPHMPGADTTFVDAVRFITAQFDQYQIPRALVSPSLFSGGGQLWALAQQFSDSMVCELFTELLPKGQNLTSPSQIDVDGTVGLPVGASQMTVLLRDKPFMVVDPRIGTGPKGTRSPYFNLPQFQISLQWLTDFDVGRNAYERINSFVLSPPPTDAVLRAFPAYQLPLWNLADQIAHGLRQMQVGLTYEFFGGTDDKATQRTIDSCLQATRRLVKDYYAANHTFFSGSMQLAVGVPWAKLGCRLRVVDPKGAEPDFHCYLEQVAHSFSEGTGTRTSLSFTRGFFGTEANQLRALAEISAKFEDGDIYRGTSTL